MILLSLDADYRLHDQALYTSHDASRVGVCAGRTMILLSERADYRLWHLYVTKASAYRGMTLGRILDRIPRDVSRDMLCARIEP